jgi:hypothetical protein
MAGQRIKDCHVLGGLFRSVMWRDRIGSGGGGIRCGQHWMWTGK